MAVSCTSDGDPTTPGATTPGATESCPDSVCGATVTLADGAAYQGECRPVAEDQLDVWLSTAEPPKARAIAGVASVEAVAFLHREVEGCGEWSLALADGLSASRAASIREEVDRGVERFGVTASPKVEGEEH
jgi:hypothetical protein